MANLTRVPKLYSNNFSDIEGKLPAAVSCASSEMSSKIADKIRESSSKLRSVTASGDSAIQSIVNIAQKIASSLEMYASAASSYAEVEPLYADAKKQLENIKKQETDYHKLCKNGPDKENHKYWEEEDGHKKFKERKFNSDKDNWNNMLNTCESKLQSMCDQLNEMINQIKTVGDTSVSTAVSNGGFSLKKHEIIPYEEITLPDEEKKYQVLSTQYDQFPVERLKEFLSDPDLDDEAKEDIERAILEKETVEVGVGTSGIVKKIKDKTENYQQEEKEDYDGIDEQFYKTFESNCEQFPVDKLQGFLNDDELDDRQKQIIEKIINKKRNEQSDTSDDITNKDTIPDALKEQSDETDTQDFDFSKLLTDEQKQKMEKEVIKQAEENPSSSSEQADQDVSFEQLKEQSNPSGTSDWGKAFKEAWDNGKSTEELDEASKKMNLDQFDLQQLNDTLKSINEELGKNSNDSDLQYTKDVVEYEIAKRNSSWH